MEGGRNGGREGLKERGERALLFLPVNWPIFTHQLPKGPSGPDCGKLNKRWKTASLCI